MAQVLGVEGLVGTHAQKIELRLLTVAQKEILADGHPKHLTHGDALLHIVGGFTGDPVICDVELFQQGKDGLLLGKQWPRRADVVVQSGNLHGRFDSFSSNFSPAR